MCKHQKNVDITNELYSKCSSEVRPSPFPSYFHSSGVECDAVSVEGVTIGVAVSLAHASAFLTEWINTPPLGLSMSVDYRPVD